MNSKFPHSLPSLPSHLLLICPPQLLYIKHFRHGELEKPHPSPPCVEKPDQRRFIAFPNPFFAAMTPRPYPAPRHGTIKNLRHNALGVCLIGHGSFLAVGEAPVVFGFEREVERICGEGTWNAGDAGFDAASDDGGDADAM